MNSTQSGEFHLGSQKSRLKEIGFERKKIHKEIFQGQFRGTSKKDVNESDIDKNIIMGQTTLVKPHLLLKYD